MASGKPISEKWFRQMTSKYQARLKQTDGIQIDKEPDAVLFDKAIVQEVLDQPDVTRLAVYFGVVKTQEKATGDVADRLTAILVGYNGKDEPQMSLLVENGTVCCPPQEDMIFIEEA